MRRQSHTSQPGEVLTLICAKHGHQLSSEVGDTVQGHQFVLVETCPDCIQECQNETYEQASRLYQED